LSAATATSALICFFGVSNIRFAINGLKTYRPLGQSACNTYDELQMTGAD